jgi:RimJ/RimL family protein N-acetyltransferase
MLSHEQIHITGETSIVLDPLVQDASAIASLLPLDSETSHWLTTEDRARFSSPDAYERWLSEQNSLAWAIHFNGIPIGVTDMTVGPRRTVMGTYLMSSQDRGHGKGTLAKIGLLQTFFREDSLATPFVETGVVAGNLAARASLQKTGFSQWGTYKSRNEAGEQVVRMAEVDGVSYPIEQWVIANPFKALGEPMASHERSRQQLEVGRAIFLSYLGRVSVSTVTT